MIDATFLRHARTDLNGKGYLATKIDLGLNERGRIEASKHIFDLDEFNVIYSSPYKRTIETAKIVYPYKEPIISDYIIQRDLGIFSETFKRDYDKELVNRINNYEYIPEGAETLYDIRLRIETFFEQLLEINDNEKVLIVTHNGIMRIIKKYYLDDENTESKNLGRFKMKIK